MKNYNIILLLLFFHDITKLFAKRSMLSILHSYTLKIFLKNVSFYLYLFLSGKKGKKKKCKTVDLMSFLADGGGTPTVPVKPFSSWIDEMEEEHGIKNLYSPNFVDIYF